MATQCFKRDRLTRSSRICEGDVTETPRTIDQIIAAAAEASGVAEAVIRDLDQRTHDISLARHVAMYVARIETHQSFQKIARAFGTDDHTLTMHGFNRVSCDLRPERFPRQRQQSNDEAVAKAKQIAKLVEQVSTRRQS